MKTIIFGTTHFAKMLYYYIVENSGEVASFTVNKQFITPRMNLPCDVVPFENLHTFFPEAEYQILPVIGYFDMNDRRKKIFKQIRDAGYKIASYIHPTAYVAKNVVFGDGLIALEHAVIQPFVSLGEGNILWSNTNISHNSSIGSFNWFAPNASLSGDVLVKDNCFFGNNCTVKNGVTVGNYTLIGAGSYVRKSTRDYQVIKSCKSEYVDNLSYNEF